MVILRYAREYWFRTGPILAAIFGAIGIALETIPSLREHTQVSPSVSITIVILVLLFAPFVGYVRQRKREEIIEEKLSHLEAAVFGGDPVVVPSTMHLHQSVSLASATSSWKYYCEFRVSGLPVTASEIHLEFTWPYGHIFAKITEAKWPTSEAARGNTQPIDWLPRGLYGCTVKLLCVPTEISLLTFWVYSNETIAVRSVRALF